MIRILNQEDTNLKELTVQFVPSQNAGTLEAKSKTIRKITI